MRHLAQTRRMPRHHLMLHRPRHSGRTRLGHEQGRLSDLILALLGTAILGSLALAAAASLEARLLDT